MNPLTAETPNLLGGQIRLLGRVWLCEDLEAKRWDIFFIPLGTATA